MTHIELQENLENSPVLLNDPDAKDTLSFLVTIGDGNPQIITAEQANFILSDLRLPKSKEWFSVQQVSESESYVYNPKISTEQLPTRRRSFSNERHEKNVKRPIVYRTRHKCSICGETHDDAWGITLKEPSYTQLFLCSDHLLGLLSSLNYLMIKNQKLFLTELV